MKAIDFSNNVECILFQGFMKKNPWNVVECGVAETSRVLSRNEIILFHPEVLIVMFVCYSHSF